jgi:hypothetical protein
MRLKRSQSLTIKLERTLGLIIQASAPPTPQLPMPAGFVIAHAGAGYHAPHRVPAHTKAAQR